MWDDLVLASDVRTQLERAWLSIRNTAALRPSKPFHVLLSGAPGTGKSAVASGFNGIPGVRFLAVGPSPFQSQFIGHASQRVRQFFIKLREDAPIVVDFDLEQGPNSDDCVFPSPESLSLDRPPDPEVISAVSMEMRGLVQDRCPVNFICQTFSADRVHHLIRSLFAVQIELPLPGESERREILKRKIAATDAHPTFDAGEVCSALAGLTNGSSARDLDRLVTAAWTYARDRAQSQGASNAVLTRDDLLLASKPRK
jgi:AAA+ superfamily predicted ATPase